MKRKLLFVLLAVTVLLLCAGTALAAGLPCDKCGGALVQRDDDKPETVLNRLEVYAKETAPLVDFYKARGILKPVVNQPSIEATTAEVLKALGL